ncbi:hypothetical protein [Mycoplasma sp. Mirounga ES2805-ORL]|uniref:hypothetical protein n=1 Tax=Mycoplasma sp. Mirounga ES2805-ORL TaxID=754514 RepID=UPI00197C7D85|nr:hypothetical protein [Mycoplasma sp. Mirounga ES2805-ORL]QSF13681.1 hypothetical protein JXZ90_00020 [Mycoplasma sp. Mirounga ES2805-ORL]
MIHDLLKSNKAKPVVGKLKNVVINGSRESIQVYSIDLDALYYNNRNDRIISWSSEKSSEEIEEMKNIDINQYNQTFENWIIESNKQAIEKTKKNIEKVGQMVDGVVLKDGRIIDGNRRFTCLRMLQRAHKEMPDKYRFNAAILDKDYETDGKEIKLLELSIQHGEEEKQGYDPIERVIGAYKDIEINKQISIEEYANVCNENVKNIEKKLEVAKFLEEFLEYINASGKYYIARQNNLHDPILESIKIIKKAKSEAYSDDEVTDLKHILFSNLLIKQTGDKTRFMRDILTLVKDLNIGKELINKEKELIDFVLDKVDEYTDNENQFLKVDEFINDINNCEAEQKIVDNVPNELLRKLGLKSKREQPLLLSIDALDKLESIDMEFAAKLTNDEKRKLNDILDFITKKANKIQEEIKNA